jgi:FkbM family methyltransferase
MILLPLCQASVVLIISGIFNLRIQQATAVTGGARETVLTDSIKGRHPDFEPQAIIDVGANDGDWSRLVRSTFPQAKLFMLEATPNKEEVLQNVATDVGNAGFKIAVMSDTPGQTVSFYQGGNTGNSMFKENTIHYTNDKPVERITSTLDEEIELSFVKIEEVDIIKLDVQGAELVVLKGATKALSHATFVQFETGPIAYNAGGACFFDVDELLREHGFFWYDIGDLFYHEEAFKTPSLGQLDVLYVKPSSPKLPVSLRNTQFCGYKPSAQQADPNFKPLQTDAMPQVASDLLESLERMKSADHPGLYFLLGFLSGACCLGLLTCVPSLQIGFHPWKKGV